MIRRSVQCARMGIPRTRNIVSEPCSNMPISSASLVPRGSALPGLGQPHAERATDAVEQEVAVADELDERVRAVAEVVLSEDRAVHRLPGAPVEAGQLPAV